jgi:hypothetical protein
LLTDSAVIDALQATATGEAVNGLPYTNEYVFMFDVARDASGSLKITGIQEFLDSGFITGFIAEVKKAQEGAQ